jgi:hypothetical protein
MRNAAAAILVIGFAGCTPTYQVNSLSGNAKVTLDPALGVYVSVPADGSYETKTYAGSGQSAASAVAVAFGKKAAALHVAAKMQPLDSTLAAARALDVGYIVIPTIAHWEQRTTEWSGKPSRMTIRLEILDAKSGRQLAAASIEGESQTWTVTSTSPEALLKDPLDKYVATLY